MAEYGPSKICFKGSKENIGKNCPNQLTIMVRVKTSSLAATRKS